MSGKNVTEVLPADEKGIARAAEVLARGGLVAVPTETVYGLAARADDPDAVARIYAAKGRPSFNPLIVHVQDLAQAGLYADFNQRALELAEDYWPGPLTLVLPAKSDTNLAPAVTAGLPTIALRVPEHPVMRSLLGVAGFGLAAPSANRSGFISPTTARHVLTSLDGRVDLILDAGATRAGIESTIVAVRSDGSIEELRPGPLQLGHRAEDNVVGADRNIEAPGQMASHYAPGKPMRLNAQSREGDEFMIGFGEVPGDCTLSPSGNLLEAASRLYDCLHLAAVAKQSRIAVATVPNEGVGRAINDRLRRAAAPPNT